MNRRADRRRGLPSRRSDRGLRGQDAPRSAGARGDGPSVRPVATRCSSLPRMSGSTPPRADPIERRSRRSTTSRYRPIEKCRRERRSAERAEPMRQSAAPTARPLQKSTAGDPGRWGPAAASTLPTVRSRLRSRAATFPAAGARRRATGCQYRARSSGTSTTRAPARSLRVWSLARQRAPSARTRMRPLEGARRTGTVSHRTDRGRRRARACGDRQLQRRTCPATSTAVRLPTRGIRAAALRYRTGSGTDILDPPARPVARCSCRFRR